MQLAECEAGGRDARLDPLAGKACRLSKDRTTTGHHTVVVCRMRMNEVRGTAHRAKRDRSTAASHGTGVPSNQRRKSLLSEHPPTHEIAVDERRRNGDQ